MSQKKKLKVLSAKKILQLKPFLDKLVLETEVPSFIDNDPVQFMHAFEDKNDRELAGFFAAIMAWGRRDIVNAKVEELLKRMQYSPASFIVNFTEADAAALHGFKHRTFNASDMYWMVKILQAILVQFKTFEAFWEFCHRLATGSGRELMAVFHEQFFLMQPHCPARVRKHIGNPEKNSSAKRLYMYLRWCLRKNSPVDPGTMSFMRPSFLKIPLDVHVACQARTLGLLSRLQNDWKTVIELTENLRLLNPDDPAKYDFALFGLGILGHEIPREFIVNDVA